MKIIKRTPQEREARRVATGRVAAIRWIVYARRDGDRELQGAYPCPNEARAMARKLQRAEHVAAWVEMAG